MKRLLLGLLLAVGMAALAAAQTSDDEAAFFGDTTTGTAPASQTGTSTVPDKYQENFTKQEPIRFGGSFKLKTTVGMDYSRDFNGWTWPYLFADAAADKAEDSNIDLEGTLYFTARTSSTLRFYGKTLVTYPFSQAINGFISSSATVFTPQAVSAMLPNIKIWELFTDISVSDHVFVRAGKQMVKWGANPFAFWSPADVISLSQIDINNRGAELEGPFAIKTNFSFGDNNFDVYVTSPANNTITSVSDLGYAARLKLLVDKWEFGVGAVNQKQTDWKFIATANGSLWVFNVFGEALVNRSAMGIAFPNGALNPVFERSDWFFSGTVGLNYNNADIYLDTLLVQYYFNGMGTGDMAGGANNIRSYINQPLAVQASIDARTLQVLGGIPAWSGMHYVAISFQESFVNDSKVHLIMTWLGNLSDGSGFINPRVNFDLTNDIVLGLTATFAYGPMDSQFRGLSGVSGFLRPVAKVGVELNLGTGNF